MLIKLHRRTYPSKSYQTKLRLFYNVRFRQKRRQSYYYIVTNQRARQFTAIALRKQAKAIKSGNHKPSLEDCATLYNSGGNSTKFKSVEH